MTRPHLAVLCCVVSVALALRAERLPLRKFTIADGLPHDSVNSIYCDSRGLLWFATREGLARFDGNRFRNLENVLLAGARVRDIVESPPGTYWIATNHGLIRFVSGAAVEFQRVPIPQNVSRVTAARKSGGVWAATDQGIFRLSGHAVEAIQAPAPHIEVLFEDDHGLWMGSEKGLFHRDNAGRLSHFTIHDGLPSDHILDIVRDSSGLWVATTSGLCRFPDAPRQALERFDRTSGLPSNYVTSILSARDGRLWVATAGGMARSESSASVSFRSFTLSHGLPDSEIDSLMEDHDGDVWGATESSGVFEIARSGFTTFTEADGLESGHIAAVGEDQRGNLFAVSTGLGSLHAFDGREFRLTRPRFPESIKNLSWGWNQIALQAHDGEWWIATGNGLCRFPAVRSLADLARVSPRVVYTTADGMGSNEIFRIFEDSRGEIWVSVINIEHPIARFERDTRRLHTYGVADGMPGDHAPSMFLEDRAGNIWVGMFTGGMLRFRNDRFEKIRGIPEGTVRDMRIDHAGRLWIATENGGAARIDDPAAETPSVRVYTTQHGLSTNQIFSITEDRFGRIYLGTSRGICRLEPESGRVKRFTTADGLPNNSINVAFADRSGTLWFGTLQGIAQLVPQRDEPKSSPSIWISALRIAGVPHEVPALGARVVGPLKLEPDQNRVEVDFESVSFRPGERLRYQYRLTGDRNWSAPLEQRSVALANLAAGTYDFEVRAISSDGGVSESPAAIHFAILPPVWRRWWFVAAVAMAAASAIHLNYHARARRLLEMERVRVRIASDLHDDIGASLSRIVVLSEVVSRQVSDPRSGGMLADVANSARSAVESMSDIVWSIDPRRDDVESLNRRLRQCAAEILDPAAIRWTFDGDVHAEKLKLGPAQRRHIHLVIKEALNNAVRHAACQNVVISMAAAGRTMHIEIADDGCGFDPYEVDGHGLRNMRSRLEELGGNVTVNTSPGQGTRLTLSMPL
jgi:ligand-binding sensor domain-containing protein/signal transduction histidine kinase